MKKLFVFVALGAGMIVGRVKAAEEIAIDEKKISIQKLDVAGIVQKLVNLSKFANEDLDKMKQSLKDAQNKKFSGKKRGAAVADVIELGGQPAIDILELLAAINEKFIKPLGTAPSSVYAKLDMALNKAYAAIKPVVEIAPLVKLLTMEEEAPIAEEPVATSQKVMGKPSKSSSSEDDSSNFYAK